MTNQRIFIPVLFAFLALSWTGSGTKENPAKTRPNLILILADDLGYGELGCYGQQTIETPHLDALASRGVRFTQFYSGSAVCAPARCALLTGLHMGHAYIRGNDEWGDRGDVWNYAKGALDPNLEGQRPLPANTLTLGKVLQQAGYTTACVGKWGLGAPLSEGRPNAQGFDFFFGYNCQRQAHNLYPPFQWKNEEKVALDNAIVAPGTKLAAGADSLLEASYAAFQGKAYAPDVQLKEALDFIRRQASQGPFFLYFASPLPHVALQARDPWVAHYRQKLGPEPPYLGQQGYLPNRTPMATYAAMISMLDEQVGAIVEALKKSGIDKNTLLVFTSDNGPSYAGGVDPERFRSAGPFPGEYGRGKGFLYEGGIRVPMIAAWPGKIKAASVNDTPAALWDVMPTFCSVAGVSAPSGLDGTSLQPALLGKKKIPQRPYLYWEFPEYGGQQAVRKGPWKALRLDMQKGNRTTMLFNLDEDIREQTNVAAQYPHIVRELEAIMDAEHRQAEIPRFRIKALDDGR